MACRSGHGRRKRENRLGSCEERHLPTGRSLAYDTEDSRPCTARRIRFLSSGVMFGSLAPDIGEQDILPLARTMVELSSSDGESAAVTELCRSATITAFDSPWSQGYDLAEALHEDLAMKFVRGACVDIDGMVKNLGIEVTYLDLSRRRYSRGFHSRAIPSPQHYRQHATPSERASFRTPIYAGPRALSRTVRSRGRSPSGSCERPLGPSQQRKARERLCGDVAHAPRPSYNAP